MADVAGYSVSVSPQPAAPLQPIYAHVTNNQACSIDPKSLTARQDGNTVYLVVKPDPTCVFGGNLSFADVSLGSFRAGAYKVVIIAADNTQLTSAPFTVQDSLSQGSIYPLVDYSDHWWNPIESGWGMSIVQHADNQLFAIWFVYNAASQPIWYTLQGGHWASPTSFTGTIYKTSGPYFGGAFDPNQVSVSQAGTATLSFDSPTTGSFAYTIDGVTGTRPISRLAF